MESASHDLVVIGGGPGGYVAALRAAQLGLNAACVDENALLGGVCLRVGCIPSKALLESSEKYYEAKHDFAAHGIHLPEVQLDLAAMLSRKDNIVQTLCRGIEGLLKRGKIAVYRGRGRFERPDRLVVENDAGTTSLAAKHWLIATGSRPAAIPGVELDGDRIGTSTEALSYAEVPGRLVVIGAGYIGLELGSVWNRLGAKVAVVETLDRILPGLDAQLAAEAKKLLQKQGLEFHLSRRVRRAYRDGDGCVVECDGMEPLSCDRVLLAVGRKANTENLGLETMGVRLDEAGRILVDSTYATNVPGVYAIGDCIGGMMLAHKASEEGVACVEKLVTGYGHVNYEAIPAVVYTHPEIASVGKTEEQLQQSEHPYHKGVFPFRANGRARTLAEIEGLVKILADEKTDRVLGVHILGPRAGDLIAEAAVAMDYGATSEDIARSCHAHPTLAESLKEAALAVAGRAIHV
ncbi:MAG: dihydrolipoyl dehydrogenase [Rhodopirellula sp.]|nr:dihydrolipoyl dehydrogenase [Rhodopirellula sp.]